MGMLGKPLSSFVGRRAVEEVTDKRELWIFQDGS